MIIGITGTDGGGELRDSQAAQDLLSYFVAKQKIAKRCTVPVREGCGTAPDYRQTFNEILSHI